MGYFLKKFACGVHSSPLTLKALTTTLVILKPFLCVLLIIWYSETLYIAVPDLGYKKRKMPN